MNTRGLLMRKKSGQGILGELKTIEPTSSYYAITLLGTDDGRLEYEVFSGWAGSVDDERPGRELRRARIVNPEFISGIWNRLRQSFLVVNNFRGFVFFVRFGGHALVNKEIADEQLSWLVAAQEAAYDGPVGYKHTTELPVTAFNRAPTQTLRMRILKRDDYRCCICGRRPVDHVDIELHVHHVRPWGQGGLTEEENLMTLCSTCHKGLEPHGEFSLFSLLNPKKYGKSPGGLAYLRGLIDYQKIVREAFNEAVKANQTAGGTRKRKKSRLGDGTN